MEINANMLIAQLNEVTYDYLSAILTRWLTWIRLFDFKVQHVKSVMHTAADSFSRRLKYPKDTKLDIAKKKNKDWILAKLKAYEFCLIKAIEEEENEAFINLKLKKRSNIFKEMKKRIQKFQENRKILILSSDMKSNKGNPRTLLVFFRDYGEDFLKIAEYIIIIKIPKEINKRNFRKFK